MIRTPPQRLIRITDNKQKTQQNKDNYIENKPLENNHYKSSNIYDFYNSDIS